jgi:hypothetical protein
MNRKRKTTKKTVSTKTGGTAYVKTITKKSGATKRITHVRVSPIGSARRVEKVTKKGKVKKPRYKSGFFLPGNKYTK